MNIQEFVKQVKLMYKLPTPSKFEIGKLKSCLNKIGSESGIIKDSQDQWFYWVIAWLLKNKTIYRQKSFTVAQLIDILVGNNEDISSLNQLKAPLMIIKYTGNEFPNSRYEDVIIQVIENQTEINSKYLILVTDKVSLNKVIQVTKIINQNITKSVSLEEF